MPIKRFLYHGRAAAVRGSITRPVSHLIDNHAHCSLPTSNAGHVKSVHGGHEISGILSYGSCHSEVHAMEEDAHGFFRTEVRSTVENMRVFGVFPMSADRMTLGLVSVYRRHWFDRKSP